MAGVVPDVGGTDGVVPDVGGADVDAVPVVAVV